ncbi:MAG: 1-acyl-sn-glycerol-3-phosphate acyltransferase [Lachnospiraceae bacterium]|nr:1-acyl-sn-glycerol-3-phosphate acyltransferase [Lachnospiraceae bacterium]
MIRFILVATVLVLLLLVSIPFLFLVWILEKINPKISGIITLYIMKGSFRLLTTLSGVKLTVIGEENIPDEPVLFIGNHRSFFDILISYPRVKRITSYIAKKEIGKAPILGIWMKRLHCQFLDRKDPRQGLQVILNAINDIKSGISVCIYPEGTRNKGEELSLLPFQKGSFKIGTKSKCAIIPMSVNNTANIFENHFPAIKSTHVILEYGKPIYIDELDSEDAKHIDKYVHNIIQETINKNASLV